MGFRNNSFVIFALVSVMMDRFLNSADKENTLSTSESKLKRHLETNLHYIVAKLRDFFAGKMKELKQQKKCISSLHQYQTMLCYLLTRLLNYEM